MHSDIFIHPGAEISPLATIGRGTAVWMGAQIREHAAVGEDCRIGKGAYIDARVRIGHRCKIENNASIFTGATLEDGVFVGPHAVLTNDRLPRAVRPDGSLKGPDDWSISPIVLRAGCSIGAGAIVVAGVEIGTYALVGAGAVVTRAIPAHALALGIPARVIGYVCACGGRLMQAADRWRCAACGEVIVLENPA